MNTLSAEKLTARFLGALVFLSLHASASYAASENIDSSGGATPEPVDQRCPQAGLDQIDGQGDIDVDGDCSGGGPGGNPSLSLNSFPPVGPNRLQLSVTGSCSNPDSPGGNVTLNTASGNFNNPIPPCTGSYSTTLDLASSGLSGEGTQQITAQFAGLTRSQTFTYDFIAPSLTGLSNVEINLDMNPYGPSLDQIELQNLIGFTATDSNGIASLTYNGSNSLNLDLSQETQFSVTIRATDTLGNFTDLGVVIDVVDPVDPTETVTINAFSDGSSDITIIHSNNVNAVLAEGLSGTCSPSGPQSVTLTNNLNSNTLTVDCNGEAWTATQTQLSDQLEINQASLEGRCDSNFTVIATKGTATDSTSAQVDITKPVLNLLTSDNPVILLEGSTYSQSNYVAINDNCSPLPNIDSLNAPDTSQAGATFNTTYTATDAAGNTADSVSLSFFIEPISGDSLIALLPMNGQQGVNINTGIEWDLLGENSQNTNVNFDVRILVGDTCPANVFESDSGIDYTLIRDDLPLLQDIDGQTVIQSTTLFQGSSLNYSTQYTLCIRAQIGENPALDQLEVPFTSASATIPTLSLQITEPETQPSGRTDIKFEGSNGEAGSLAIIYKRQDDGSFQEIASTIIATNGTFERTLNLPDGLPFSTFTYYARMQRNGNLGDPSAEVQYVFDPALTLDRPIIDNLIVSGSNPEWTLQLEIENYNAELEYRVWKRAGYSAECTSDCFGDTPFKLLQTQAVGAGALIVDATYDPTSAIENAVNTGTAYFVTAHDPITGSSSQRSNALTAEDNQSVQTFENGVPEFRYIVQSYGVEIFACNVPQAVLDTDPDLIRTTQWWVRTGPACPDNIPTDPSAGSNVAVGLDVLVRATIPQNQITNCIPLGVIEGLNPNTGYCFNTCLSDNNPDNAESCQTNLDDQTTPDDNQAPGFNGIEQAIPLNGNSVRVTYSEAIAQSFIELIQYQIFATSVFEIDSDGNRVPVFNQAATIVDEDTTEVIINGLSDDTEYAFMVTALDDTGNAAGADIYKKTNTLRDAPKIQSAQMQATGQANLAMFCLAVSDRNAGDIARIEEISIAPEQASLNGDSTQGLSALNLPSTELVTLLSASDNSRLVGRTGAASLSGGNGVNEQCIMLEVGDLIRSQQFSGVTGLLVVEDSSGLQDQYAFSGSLVDNGSRNVGTYSSAAGGSMCGTISAQKDLSQQPWIWLITLISMTGMMVYRRPAQSRNG